MPKINVWAALVGFVVLTGLATVMAVELSQSSGSGLGRTADSADSADSPDPADPSAVVVMASKAQIEAIDPSSWEVRLVGFESAAVEDLMAVWPEGDGLVPGAFTATALASGEQVGVAVDLVEPGPLRGDELVWVMRRGADEHGDLPVGPAVRIEVAVFFAG